jgi:hypothetical protein
MAMKHFKAEERADFVNRATSSEQMETIQKHLESGRETGAKHSRRNENSRVVEVLFDSFLEPVFSGARAAYTGIIRHMLYRADPFQIDLQIEVKPGQDRMVVTGQVLDVGRSEIFGSGLHVTLSNRRGNLVHELTNGFGEFHFEIKNSDHLELALRCDPAEPIVIILKDPLGNMPGGGK